MCCGQVSTLTCDVDVQGPPGEKGAPGSSDVIEFNEKLLDAFQVRCGFDRFCLEV